MDPGGTGLASRIDRYFGITERGSTVQTELRGGLATFFTMAYIVVLNPIILSSAADVNGARLDFAQVASSTALVAAVMTILMGVVGRYPFALAAGLGLNGVVAFQLASQMSWPAAMGVVVIEGLVITALVLTGFRQAVFEAVPLAAQARHQRRDRPVPGLHRLRRRRLRPPRARTRPTRRCRWAWASAAGCWAGRRSCSSSACSSPSSWSPARPGAPSSSASWSPPCSRSILNAIVDVTAQIAPGQPYNPKGWSLNVPKVPDKILSNPDFGLIGDFSLGGSFAKVGVISALLLVFTLMLADFFDTMGTVVGVGRRGRPAGARTASCPASQRVLLVDSLAAAAGGAASASSNTTYIESASGVADGARTGLASVATGVLFLGALFVSPADRHRPLRGGVARPGGGRLPAHGAGEGHPVGRLRHRHPRLPHHRAHALHLLHHQRDRRRLRVLRR